MNCLDHKMPSSLKHKHVTAISARTIPSVQQSTVEMHEVEELMKSRNPWTEDDRDDKQQDSATQIQ
jgi:hypothetical protein